MTDQEEQEQARTFDERRTHLKRLRGERDQRDERECAVHNPFVLAALQLLEQVREDRPDVNQIALADDVGTGWPDGSACRTRPWHRRIQINKSGDAYKQALRGDCRRLAAMLRHELDHLRGYGEAEAYASTARVLEKLRALEWPINWGLGVSEQAAIDDDR